MNSKYSIYYLCMLILTFSCTSNKSPEQVPYVKKDRQVYERVLTSYEKDESELVHDKVPLNIDDNKIIINWEIYQSADKQLMFSIPSTWSIEEKIGNEIYCNVNEQKKAFFLLLAHNKVQHDLTLDGYLDLVYNTFATDTTEIIVDMKVQELTLKDRIGYFLEVETLLDNVLYKSYSF